MPGLVLWWSSGFLTAVHARLPRSVTVLHTDPTRLIASARLASMPIQILVAHGPHRGHEPAIKKEWWERTAQLCRTFVHSDVWLFLLDANSRVGSHTSPSIGPHQADPEDISGALMHRLLVNVDVWLPATFDECMQGDGGTLVQKRNSELARSGQTTSACQGDGYSAPALRMWTPPCRPAISLPTITPLLRPYILSFQALGLNIAGVSASMLKPLGTPKMPGWYIRCLTMCLRCPGAPMPANMLHKWWITSTPDWLPLSRLADEACEKVTSPRPLPSSTALLPLFAEQFVTAHLLYD